ncbi:DnaJ domain-containing protein [Romboutsia sp. CE17]|uniref:DnaJ domain-containing protein n=1 Tax=Romboutsia sp. CE17 TaxID=2724150 RepID=UPI001442BBA3|nr:DnaJ domain-containing protein [Romboutsia sp. CE17]QJA07661.1 DnaJ domain-containing protein [Romboutsia sp. CE17]
MSFFKSVIGGAIGFVVGGPLGAAGGAVLASRLGSKEYKYSINCPHCYKSLGVDTYGRYNCCHCEGVLTFSEDGVIKDTRIDVICPYCKQNLLIEGPGKWNCCKCNQSFEYTIDNSVKEYNSEEETCLFIIFAAFAKFCKANGQIKNEHISTATDIMDNYYGFNEENRKLSIKYFRMGRDSDKTFEDYCMKLNDICDDKLEDDREIKNDFLICLYKLATCLGKTTYEEEKMLNYAAAILKIEPYLINKLKEEYIENSLDKYYEILGCKRGDSISIIKSSYRKIVNECHPDKILSKNLPEYLVNYSTQRFREVQEAYEKIKLDLEA